MKKETITTAIVFFAVGFLGGIVFDAQKNWNAQNPSPAGSERAASDGASGIAPPNTGSGTTPKGLPEGHPPVDLSAVIKGLEDQAEQNPREPGPKLNLANFLYDHRRFQEAIEWYKKALELDPNNVNARTDLGTAFFNLGRSEDALREYRRSLEIDPRHEPTLFNLIMVNLVGARDLRAARAAWEKLRRLNPNYPGLDRMKQELDASGAAAAGARVPR